jgi:hypothetical protein
MLWFNGANNLSDSGALRSVASKVRKARLFCALRSELIACGASTIGK